MRERAEATASSARWCCLLAPSSSRSATASVSEVSVSVTRRPRAIRSSRPSEMSLTVCVARRMPPRMRIEREHEHGGADGGEGPHPGAGATPGRGGGRGREGGCREQRRRRAHWRERRESGGVLGSTVGWSPT